MQTHKFYLLFGLFLITLAPQLSGQSLSRVPGDFIIHTRSSSDLEEVITKINRPLAIHQRVRVVRALCAESHIWLLHAHPASIDDNLLLNRMKRFPEVIAVQFNHLLEDRSVPSDPLFDSQWQWNNTGQTGGKIGADIKMVDAWKITKGGITSSGDTIVVAVVDNGINLSHPDFTNNLWVNHQEIPENGIDDDNNGYIDDHLGWNTTQSNDNVGIGGSHGTPVSGMIGGEGNNSVGGTGVNWNVKIMTIRPNSTQEALVIESYSYALTQRKIYNATNGESGAFVVAVNSSWGINYGQPADAPIWCAFYDSLGVHGILSTGATANLNIDVDVVGDLPTGCSSEFLVSVTSSNHNDLKTNSAAFGKTTIDIAAPGQSIYTAHNNGGYGITGGTSFASPTIAGLIALLYSGPCPGIGEMAIQDPPATALLIRDALYNGVDVLTHLEPILVTGGRANAYKSLLTLAQVCSTCPEHLDVTATPTSENEAIISWVDVGNSSSTELRWREVGNPTWIHIEIVDNPYVLSGLSNCEAYEVEVRAICGSDTSEYAATSFTSFGCCLPPEDLVALTVSDSSITLGWTPFPGASGINCSYLEDGASDYIVLTDLLLDSLTINNLKPCTKYTFQLASSCNDSTSNNSNPLLVITTGCPECPPPGNFTLMALNDTSVTFIWDPGLNASSYNCSYLEEDALDYVQYPDIDITSWTESGLTPCTKYTFEVRSQCSAILSEPTIIEITTTGCVTCSNQPICTSNGTDSSLEFIESVQIASLINKSGNDDGFADFTSLSVDLLTHYKYSYTLTPGFSAGSLFTENWYVWIDYNQNGDFGDPGELVIGPIASSEAVTGLFKIPGNALPGFTRMRVSMSFSSGIGPCTTFSYGEVEDYCVQIIPAQEPCDYPDVTTVVSTTTSSATLDWTAIGSAMQYIVEYRASGQSLWTEVFAPGTPYTLDGLAPCTEYELRVRSDCDTAQSIPALPIFFTTKGCGACLDIDYCDAGAENSPNQWIDEFELDGVPNVSGPDGGYAFFEDIQYMINTNHEYEIRIKPGNTFGINNNYYRVYIDYNQNGTFGPFEQVGKIDNTTSDEIIITFEVPNGALEGPTRMRVVMQSYGGDDNPCAVFFTGEVEDYCVHITKAQAPCIPRPLILGNYNEHQATLSWKSVIPSLSYQLEYKEQAATDWIELATQSTFLTLNDLLPCTSYEARMRTLCDGDTTVYSPILTFKTKGCGACVDSIYCSLIGESSTYEWVQAVSLGTLNNVSGNNQGYAFFQGLTTRIDTGYAYAITLTPGFQFSGTEMIMGAWIDFNQNGIFSANERIVNVTATGPVTQVFTCPGVPLGETRLRVAMSAFNTIPSACGSIFYGEVEDYCVQLTAREIPCLIPSYFDTVSVGMTQASVAWDTVPTSIGYILRFRELGAMDWAMEQPVLGNSYVFSDLLECKEYEVQLVTICQNKLSESGILIFKTECSVGIEDQSNTSFSAVRVYPNPFQSAPLLEFNAPISESMSLELWDARGGLVMLSTYEAIQGANKIQLQEIPSLTPGLYVLRLISRSGKATSLRLLKQ